MLKPNPKDRITSEAILNHPWMEDNVDKPLVGVTANLKKYNARRKLKKAQMVAYASSIIKGITKK